MKSKSPLVKKFGERVRHIRMMKGITSQIEFASRAKLDRTYIGGIERGERNITLEAIEKVAKGLGVEVGDLF